MVVVPGMALPEEGGRRTVLRLLGQLIDVVELVVMVLLVVAPVGSLVGILLLLVGLAKDDRVGECVRVMAVELVMGLEEEEVQAEAIRHDLRAVDLVVVVVVVVPVVASVEGSVSCPCNFSKRQLSLPLSYINVS